MTNTQIFGLVHILFFLTYSHHHYSICPLHVTSVTFTIQLYASIPHAHSTMLIFDFDLKTLILIISLLTYLVGHLLDTLMSLTVVNGATLSIYLIVPFTALACLLWARKLRPWSRFLPKTVSMLVLVAIAGLTVLCVMLVFIEIVEYTTFRLDRKSNNSVKSPPKCYRLF